MNHMLVWDILDDFHLSAMAPWRTGVRAWHSDCRTISRVHRSTADYSLGTGLDLGLRTIVSRINLERTIIQVQDYSLGTSVRTIVWVLDDEQVIDLGRTSTLVPDYRQGTGLLPGNGYLNRTILWVRDYHQGTFMYPANSPVV